MHALVAAETEPEEVVVLRHDLGAGPGEVERERRHAVAQVVDPEDEVVGQRGRVPPDDPANARVDQPVLVARGVDRGDPRQPEVPDHVGVEERRDEGAGRAVDVHRNVQTRRRLEGVEGGADLLHRLVRAVVGRAEHGDDADRVLVAQPDGLVGGHVVAVAVHRHGAQLDVPVVGELLPADLDVDAGHHVGPVGGLAGRLPPVLPAALERQPAEHRRLARPGGGATGGRVAVRGVPEPAEHVHAAGLDLRGLRILVLVDHVLVEAFGDQPVGLRLHPGGDERRHVEPGVAVEHQLVVDDLVRHVARKLPRGQLMPGNPALEPEDRLESELAAGRLRPAGVLQHRDLPSSPATSHPHRAPRRLTRSGGAPARTATHPRRMGSSARPVPGV